MYNFLKGLPIQVITHNFGSVDSIGVVVYCSGSNRISVPHARFLLHPLNWQYGSAVSLFEEQIEESLKSLRIDMSNIINVISSNIGKTTDDIKRAMLNRTTLNSEEAKEFGLVHEIKTELLPKGAEKILIMIQ